MTFEIQLGQCFGCLALSALTFRGMWRELRADSSSMTSPRLVRSNLWLSTRLPFEIDDSLRRQLGGSVARKLTGDEIFVMFKRPAPRLWHPLRDGSREERRQVNYFQYGLAVWLGIPA